MSEVLPRIGVLLPVREGEPFLPMALRSLANQTYSHWFCYLIADGDASFTAQAAHDELPSHSYRVLNYPIRQRGLSAGLNYGLRVIRESLVARFDSDDLCAPDRFEEQSSLMLGDANLIMTCSSTSWIDESNEPIGGGSRINDRDLTRKLGWYNPITHSSVMYRREDVCNVGGYNPLARGCEDYDLWLRLLKTNTVQLKVSEKPLVRYRKHEAQLTNKSMVGTQLGVIDSSRRAFLVSGQTRNSQTLVTFKSFIWGLWQRLRFP